MTDRTTARAVCERLLAEHRELSRRIEEVRRWWDEADEFGLPKFGEMGDRVQQVRKLLAQHFADEERGGFLAPVLQIAPHFTRQAEELQRQHPHLLNLLDDFVARLEAAEPPFSGWQEARREFEEILAELRQHEAGENAIAHSAFEDDLGGGD